MLQTFNRFLNPPALVNLKFERGEYTVAFQLTNESQDGPFSRIDELSIKVGKGVNLITYNELREGERDIIQAIERLLFLG